MGANPTSATNFGACVIASREYHRDYSRSYYHERKAEYIRRLGGACSNCSSTENLQFDHKSREGKAFSIGKLLNFSRAKVEEELQKCQLLCRECHDLKTSTEAMAPSCKLTWDQVEEIRALSKTTRTRDLAIRYGLSWQSMNDVVKGRSYKR